MKASYALSLVLGAMVLVGAARAADPMDPRGLWLRREGGVQLSFYGCGTGLLCGKVVGAENPADRTSIGMVILRGAKEVAPNEWRGTLYNIDDGKGYDSYITVGTKGADLSVKGCVMGFLCRGETWTRLSSSARDGSSNESASTATLAAAQ
jgi:uncharacterized protein (DUF2147 family)